MSTSPLAASIGALLAAKRREISEFDLNYFCFDKQYKFIMDPAKFKTAVCSRRAGKTIACAADLTDTALKNDNTVELYITLSRINAKRIVWPELTRLNRVYKLGGVQNETELSIKYPNGSVIYCSGAKDKSEIENFRGLPIKKAYVDEAQAFRDYIRELIDDVLSKALFDHNGTLCLTGTPRAVPTGYFYECSQSLQWSHHGWTMFDNPHLARKSGIPVMDLVKQDMERMGVGLDHPKIRRECFGEWEIDTDSLVLHYDAKKNDYTALPEGQKNSPWSYVIGVDLGYHDSDSISVLGWQKHSKQAYLVHEDIRAKQGITELAQRIEALVKKYDPMTIVMDTGGLGKKIAEEIQTRYSIPIKAAEKVRKIEFIEILNDAMRTERFFAKRSSRFAQDSMLIEWDKESIEPKISDAYHSDAVDSSIYAYRECLHWLEEPTKPRPKPNSMEEKQADIDEHMERLEQQVRAESEETIWGDYESILQGGQQ